MITIAHAAAGLEDEDRVPFEHALALAHALRGRLVSVHARRGAGGTFPDPAAILASWGLSDAVPHERRHLEHEGEPLAAAQEVLRALDPALVVVGTAGRSGLARLLVGSRGMAIAHGLATPTLVVPAAAHPLVRNSRVMLRRIIVPTGDARSAEAACAALVARLGPILGAGTEVVFLQVGSDGSPPSVTLPPGVTSRVARAEGGVAAAVVDAGLDADLIAMATDGRDSWLDSLFGTHTERVVRETPCPVLVVPMRRAD